MYAPHLESWQCLHTFQERSLNIVDTRSSVASITHVTLSLSLLPPSPLRRPSVPPAPSHSSVPPAALPSNSKELVPLWFKVCCWSLIKGRPIPPFSFQPYVLYVLLLGQLLLARAGTLKHQPKEVRQPAAAWAVTAMQPGSRRQSASSFSNPIQHSEQ